MTIHHPKKNFPWRACAFASAMLPHFPKRSR